MASSKSRHVPALDGLRCLAVLVVVAYHMNMSWAPGGLLGVTMFFVLSGYLITSLLIKEYNQSGTISLKNFWLRRVRRIIPAVVFAIVGIGFLCTIFNHALLTKMRPDVIPSLFFVNNWWQILHNVSYFEALGAPSPLTHFWSLSIEEQFYLIWPVTLLICMKLGVSKTAMQRGTLVLAALSAIEMIVLFDPQQDPSRVYYGTDTRAFSLLIGAYLAFIWPFQDLDEQAGNRMTPNGRLIFNLVGVGAVVGLLLMVGLTDGFSPFIYRGGLVLCSVLTAVAIAVMAHPIGWIGKFFELPPFVWVGKISYSMYLWHYPIILLMTPGNLGGEAPLWLRGIQLIVIFAVSAFSFYIVEDPIRHGAIGNFLGRLSAREFTLGGWVRDHLVPVVVCALFFVVPLVGWTFVPDTSAVQNEAVIGKQTIPAQTIENVQRTRARYEAQKSENKPDVLLIGDSVAKGMDGYGAFAETFPHGYVDAVVGRQFYDAAEVYADYRDSGMVGDVVVIALGTNGYATVDDAEKLMDEVGDEQKIWFVTTRGPEQYTTKTNETIWTTVSTHDNASVIDWYSLSANHPEYFDGDGTHLTSQSAKIYAQMIYEAVKNDLPPWESSYDPSASSEDGDDDLQQAA